MSNTQSKERANVAFAAIDPYIETHIVSPAEKTLPGKDFIEWGTNNQYPDYLLELYNEVSTLRAIINGNVDMISGDEVSILALREMESGMMNQKRDTIAQQVRDLAKDHELYGGFALQIIRGKDGKPSEIYHIDMRFLRTNKECDVFYYSEEWKKGGKKKVVVYPKFMASVAEKWKTMTDEERDRHASSILFVKDIRTQTYPSPKYAASVKACEIERCIDDFHLNAINNGFTGSQIVNFNNGRPASAEIMNEIEDNFCEKFSGHQNAGRIAFSWNENRASATTIDQVQVQDFGEKYKSLAEHSRQQIFTSFCATPSLFGIVEKTGFNNVEYDSAFKLYNRTQIKPVQEKIRAAYDMIYGSKNVMTIKPFSLKDEAEENAEEAAEMLAIQIGVGGTQSLTAIIADPNLTNSQKEQLLIKLFNFTPEEAKKLFE